MELAHSNVSSQEGVDIIQIKPSDIQIGRFQPRREQNPAYDEIKASMQTHGQRDPITVIPLSKAESKKTGFKYAVSTSGNTRVKIAQELKFKFLHARISSETDELSIRLSAIDDNRARGKMSFSDTAWSIYQCYKQYMVATDDKGNIKKFHGQHCSMFAAPYVYLCVECSGIFDFAKLDLSVGVSKRIAESICRYHRCVKQSLENFKHEKNEKDAMLQEWTKKIYRGIEAQNGDHLGDNIDDITDDFLNDKIAVFVSHVLKRTGISDKETLYADSLYGARPSPIPVSQYLNEKFGTLIRNAIFGGKAMENQEHDLQMKIATACPAKNTGDASVSKGGAAKNNSTEKKSAATPAINFTASVVEPSPWCGGREGQRVLPEYALGYAIGSLRLCGSQKEHDEMRNLWATLLPGLYAPGKSKPKGGDKDIAFEFIEYNCAFSSEFLHGDWRWNQFITLRKIDKKFGVLSHLLSALGYPADRLDANDLALAIALVARTHQRIYSAHAPFWSAARTFKIRASRRNAHSDKIIGICLWPHVNATDMKVRDSMEAYDKGIRFFGTPDIKKPVGYVAGFFDSSRKREGFRCPTENGKIEDTISVYQTPGEALRSLYHAKIKASLPNGSDGDMSARQVRDMLDFVLGEQQITDACVNLEKQVRIWQKRSAK